MILAPVGLIPVELALLSVQQFIEARNVRLARASGRQAVHQTVLAGADVDFHSEVPLLVLPGLLHLGITALGFIFGRTGRADDGCIHDRSRLEQQPLFFQQRAHLGEYLLGQLVLFQQMPKVKDGGLIRDRVLGQLNAGKAAHRLDVVERVFGLRIGQVEPLLHEVHAQHALHDRRV